MRHIFAALLLLTAVAAFAPACNDDAPAPGPCGRGEAISSDDGLACVYPNDLIIEGFLCPEAAPNRHDFKDETVCSAAQELADAFLDQLRGRGYGAEPTDPGTPGDSCGVPGSTTPSSDGCNTCSCTDSGFWACTERGCVQTCTPGETRPSDDGCNTCSCTDTGDWVCTERGCVESCTEGETRPADDGCNTCSCTGGQWACTEIACNTTCVDGETMTTDDGCNTCSCAGGEWFCTQRACIDCSDVQDEATCAALDCSWNTCPQDDVMCPSISGTFCSDRPAPGDACDLDPAISVQAADGCNTCNCTDMGVFACTRIGCIAPVNPGDSCDLEGDTAAAADGCNTCTCTDSGFWACTEIACNTTCVDGETRPSDDGCNTCSCAGGEWLCTERACLDCSSIQDEATCASVNCSWNTCPQDDVVCPSVSGTFCSALATPGESCELDPAIRVDAIDGCNTCNCTGGAWACTEIACGN